MKCILCDREIKGYGNNAQPIAAGECCDDCNMKKVIPARINNLDNVFHDKDTDQERKDLKEKVIENITRLYLPIEILETINEMIQE